MHIFIFSFLICIHFSFTETHFIYQQYDNVDSIQTTFQKGINFIFQNIRSKPLYINHTSSKTTFNLFPGVVYMLDPKCESCGYSYTLDGLPMITYKKCAVLVIMETFDIKNPNRVVGTFENYLSELYYETIQIKLQNKLLAFDSSYDDDYIYNFNVDESLFDIRNLKSTFNTQMKSIGEELHKKFFEEIKYNVGYSHLESFLRSVFNILYWNGPFMNTTFSYNEDSSNKVTYISYGTPQLEDVVITKEKIFLGRLIVNFDYAIDFDINCSEGYFIISDFEFNIDEFQYEKDSVVFEPISLSDAVKKFVMEHFEKEFVKAIREYKEIGNKKKET